ncbi:unnamed protein product, partial [Owenia fusiformis]
MVSLCILAVLPLLVSSQSKQPFEFTGENGVDSWGEDTPLCDTGTRQSPINIIHEDTVIDRSLYSLQFYNLDSKVRNNIANDGVKVRIDIGEKQNVFAYFGGLPGVYRLRDVNINWPASHLIDGYRADLELTLRGYNAELYKSIDDADGKKDGIALFSVLYKISSAHNFVLEPLISSLKNIRDFGNEVDIERGLLLEELLPASARSSYYRYNGSIPHPPCTETGYIWYVFADHLYLSENQLNELKMLRDSNGNRMDNLFRPVQSLEGRIVSRPAFRIPRVDFLSDSDKAPPTKKESCLDVFFVIDESCSVYEDIPKVKQLLLDVVDKTIIGRRSVLMSLVRYHDDVNLNFYHLNTTNNEVTKKFIETQPLGQTASCKTQTYDALKFNSEFFFRLGKNASDKYTGVRSNSIAKDVLFVITDGVSIPIGRRSQALKQAQKIRISGVKMFTIGLHNQKERDGSPELLGFVNDDANHAFSIDDIDLADTVAGIINSADPCFSTTTPRPTTTTTLPEREIVTNFDIGTTTKTPTTTKPPIAFSCRDKLDIILIIDTSQSLLNKKQRTSLKVSRTAEKEWEYRQGDNMTSENLKTVKEFLRELLDLYVIGHGATHVAILTFDEEVVLHQKLNDTKNRETTIQALMGIKEWTGKGTRTDEALFQAKKILSSRPDNRPEAADLVILVTDGVVTPCCETHERGCCRYEVCKPSITGNPCLSKDGAIERVTNVSEEIHADFKEATFIVLSLPNKPEVVKKAKRNKRGVPSKATKDIAFKMYKNIVGKGNEMNIVNFTKFDELEHRMKDVNDKICEGIKNK